MVGQPGDTDPDEPERPGTVAQRPVEQRAGELPDALAVVRADLSELDRVRIAKSG